MRKRKVKVTLSEDVLKLIVEGKVKLVKDVKIKYGKYKIIKRYVPKK